MSTRRRAWVVGLALAAIVFVGARPVCEASVASGSALHVKMAGVIAHSAAGHAPLQGGYSSPTCCASAVSGALVKVSGPWTQTAGGGKLAPVFVLAAIPLLPRAAAARFRSDPRTPSYYKRSARILR